MENFNMWPGGIFAWIIVGLLSGWIAGTFMKGGGYGIVGDIIIGLIGAALGGFIFSFFMHGTVGFWGSVLVSIIGACVLIFILRLFSSKT